MIDMNIFDTLMKLSKRPPMYIYKDETTGQINEIPLSKFDSAGAELINKTVKQFENPAKLIHDLMFGN